MNKEIDELIKLLLKVNGFEEFLNTFDNSNGLESLCEEFYEYKKKNGGINTTLKETFDQINRCKHSILEKYGTNVLYYINPDKIIDDSELDEFRKDWESSRTNSVASKLRDIQRYKTYTEYGSSSVVIANSF